MDCGVVDTYNLTVGTLQLVHAPIRSPSDCVRDVTTYEARICYNSFEVDIPVMIGSIFDTYYDKNSLPAGIFIINGILKTVNTQEVYAHHTVDKYGCTLSIGRVKLIEYNTFTLKEEIWRIPLNAEDIVKYSVNPERIKRHLEGLTRSKHIMGKACDQILLAAMFDKWLGLREESPVRCYYVTVGDMMYNTITGPKCKKSRELIIESFKTHTWYVNKRLGTVSAVSRDVTFDCHMSLVSAVRCVSKPIDRKNAPIKERLLRTDMRKRTCCLETVDGAQAGTVSYIARGARLVRESCTFTPDNKGKHCFIDGNYMGVGYIDKCFDEAFMQFGYTDTLTIVPGSSDIGESASHIPYIKYNPAIRGVFASAMFKSAITADPRIKSGWYNDTRYLVNGEHPIIGEPFEYPSGHTLTVAIMPYFGYNVEDAVVISESCASRYKSVHVNTVRIFIEDARCVDLSCNDVRYRYDVIAVGQYVHEGDVLTTLYRPYNDHVFEHIRTIHSGMVTHVHRTKSYIHVRIEREHYMQVGDKVTSRHGQKGVISLIIPDYKMPYTAEHGAVDLVMTPFSYPARMTMGQLREMECEYVKVSIEGKYVQNPIMVGKCYYIALKHQADNKWRCRNDGPSDNLTMHAVSTRRREKGIRFGQMEKDALLAAGAFNVLNELFSIDLTGMRACNECNVIMLKCEHEGIIIRVHQSLKIITQLTRALGRDIRINYTNNTYRIVPLDLSKIETIEVRCQKDLSFYEIDTLGVYKGNIIILPGVMRDSVLNTYYSRLVNSGSEKILKDINNHVKGMLNGRNGHIRKSVEGKRLNHTCRAVIVPRPELPINHVQIPQDFNLGSDTGLLGRHPTLSRMSFGSVKLVRKGSEKVIGINPRICSAFNADFDGDEMNVYAVKNSYSEACEKIPVHCEDIQDYRLAKYWDVNLEDITWKGITASHDDLRTIIELGVKGRPDNMTRMFIRIGEIYLGGETIGIIESCYSGGLNDDEFYIDAQAAREGLVSIGINTPVTGDANRRYNRIFECT